MVDTQTKPCRCFLSINISQWTAQARKRSDKIYHILTKQNILPAIRQSGFLSWHQIMKSDHRTGYVNFAELTLFWNISKDSTNIAIIRLSTNYPEAIDNYLQMIIKKIKKELIHEASLIIIYKITMRGWTQHSENKYNNLDKRVKAIFLYTENKLFQKQHTQPPGAPPLIKQPKK